MVALTQVHFPWEKQKAAACRLPKQTGERDGAGRRERNGVESALIFAVYFRDFHHSLKTGDLQLATPHDRDISGRSSINHGRVPLVTTLTFSDAE